MCRPTLIAGREAVFEFLPENLPFIYIDNTLIKKTVTSILVFSNDNSFRVLFDKIASVYFI